MTDSSIRITKSKKTKSTIPKYILSPTRKAMSFISRSSALLSITARHTRLLIPVNEDGEEESSEYVILKCSVDENGEDILETIEDDDEFDEIADIFDDEFSDILYDED